MLVVLRNFDAESYLLYLKSREIKSSKHPAVLTISNPSPVKKSCGCCGVFWEKTWWSAGTKRLKGWRRSLFKISGLKSSFWLYALFVHLILNNINSHNIKRGEIIIQDFCVKIGYLDFPKYFHDGPMREIHKFTQGMGAFHLVRKDIAELN